MTLIERFARGVVDTLGKDDFRRIMNDTLDHMLRSMTRRERMQFCEDLVDNSVERMLRGLTNEEKERLFASLLPRILQHFPSGEAALEAARAEAEKTPPAV
ncbi:MAG: hypothetical protein ACHQ7M_11680 [Chloroflexota bacterium]|jgi:hypothetical protein